jgi:hypothetical protein
MCESMLTPQVEALVRRKVAAYEMFTAYDVTRELRAMGETAYHDEVRNVVHFMYRYGQMGASYERTLANLGGARGPAYIYHHACDDPCTYRSRHRNRRALHSLGTILAQLRIVSGGSVHG